MKFLQIDKWQTTFFVDLFTIYSYTDKFLFASTISWKLVILIESCNTFSNVFLQYFALFLPFISGTNPFSFFNPFDFLAMELPTPKKCSISVTVQLSGTKVKYFNCSLLSENLIEFNLLSYHVHQSIKIFTFLATVNFIFLLFNQITFQVKRNGNLILYCSTNLF